jgi:hypothetical protein
MYTKPTDIYGHGDKFRLWSTSEPKWFIVTQPGTNWPLHGNVVVAVADTQAGITQAYYAAVRGRL